MCNLYLDLIGARTNDLPHWRRNITTPMWFETTATWEVTLHLAIFTPLPPKQKQKIYIYIYIYIQML